MFRIEDGAPGMGLRLIAPGQLSRNDFRSIAEQLSAVPFRARKLGFIAARTTARCERIETHWNGQETTATAEVGDWIATNMDAHGHLLRDARGNLNVYVIKADRFPELYERVTGANEHGEVFRPRGSIEAVFLPGGFEILAPWGETQRADAGYLIDNGSEVYGNAKETFERTYRWE